MEKKKSSASTNPPRPPSSSPVPTPTSSTYAPFCSARLSPLTTLEAALFVAFHVASTTSTASTLRLRLQTRWCEAAGRSPRVCGRWGTGRGRGCCGPHYASQSSREMNTSRSPTTASNVSTRAAVLFWSIIIYSILV
jgi:hypothetical protein